MQVSDLNTPPALHPSPPKRAYGIQEAGWAPRDGLGSMAKMKKSPHFPYRKLNPGCPARSLVTILRYTRFHAALDTRGGGEDVCSLFLPGNTSFNSGLLRIQPFLCWMMHWNMFQSYQPAESSPDFCISKTTVCWCGFTFSWLHYYWFTRHQGFLDPVTDAEDQLLLQPAGSSGVASPSLSQPHLPSPISVVISDIPGRASTVNSRLTSVTFASSPSISNSRHSCWRLHCWTRRNDRSGHTNQ